MVLFEEMPVFRIPVLNLWQKTPVRWFLFFFFPSKVELIPFRWVSMKNQQNPPIFLGEGGERSAIRQLETTFFFSFFLSCAEDMFIDFPDGAE